MLDHIAEQIDMEAAVIADFAKRTPTRYEQLATIKQRFGYRDLTHPLRREVSLWLKDQAIGVTDRQLLLSQLHHELRRRNIVNPGISVTERMAGEAMYAAESNIIAQTDMLFAPGTRRSLDRLVDDNRTKRQSRLSWLREPDPRIAGKSLFSILSKLDLLRGTGVEDVTVDPAFEPRMVQFAKEGLRYTAQALQQMGRSRRRVILFATLRDLERSLVDAAITMFGALVGRAYLRARKRLEQSLATSADTGRKRLLRVANVLEALTAAARTDGDMRQAVEAVAPLDLIEQDAALIRRTAKPTPSNTVGELAPDYKTFKRLGPLFLKAIALEGRASTRGLRDALAILAALEGDWRRPLPDNVPVGHIERRWRPHVFSEGGINRTFWELATYFALSSALASGDIWVSTSKLHQSLDTLLVRPKGALPTTRIGLLPNVDSWLADREKTLDAALRGVAERLSDGNSVLFTGDKLRFPKEPKAIESERDAAKRLAQRCYNLIPAVRITDVLSQVEQWTGFISHFGHVSSGLPPSHEKAFLATLIAEATNLGLSRMAEICSAGSRRVLMRTQTWHMREETFEAALACLTDAIHAQPLSSWFGEGWRASADGQAFHLGGAGEAGGQVNAHYGRDPVVKIYTTITDRYAPLHQTVIAGTAGEAIHALDGILGHESSVTVSALHVDGGGVSDIVFAIMSLLGLNFEPRIPRLSDRRLYAFEPAKRYGRLAPLFGHRLNRDLIRSHWPDVEAVVDALRAKSVTPSLILKKLSAYRQQNSLAAALREIGRIERTLFTLRWFEDPQLRQLVTGELNKGEARNSLARAVAFHRLGRFRDRGLEN